MLSIIEVDNCIGLRSRDKVYIHKNLVHYPALREKVIAHEMNHSEIPGLRVWEWRMDFGAFSDILSNDGLRFIKSNPKSLMQLLPVQRINGMLLIDIESFLILGIAIFALWVML